MSFARNESLARSDLAEGLSLAERAISGPAMKRKYVQKSANISEHLFQNLSEKEIKASIKFKHGFLGFKFEKFWCPFRTNPNQATKRNGVQTECTNRDLIICEPFQSRRKKMDHRFYYYRSTYFDSKKKTD